MMKTFTLLFVLAGFQSLAQYSYEGFAYDYRMDGLRYNIDKYPRLSGTKQSIHTYTHGGKTTITTRLYTTDGKIAEIRERNKKGKDQTKTTYSYSIKGQKNEIGMYTKGKLHYTYLYAIYDEGKPLYQEKFNVQKQSSLFKTDWTYNSDGCRQQMVMYRKGKLRGKWVDEYYDHCKRSRSLRYNGKGKLKEQWTFDCKSEGEKLEKKKDTRQYCTWEESSATILTRVYQVFDEKGRIHKYIHRYALPDTSIVMYESYDAQNRLEYKQTYDHSWNKVLTTESFNKKGKQLYKVTFTYEKGLETSYRYERKGIIRRHSVRKYNDAGALAEEQWFHRKHGKEKLYSTMKTEYLK